MISKLNTGARESDRHVRGSGVVVLLVMGVSDLPVLPARAPMGWSLLGRTRFPS